MTLHANFTPFIDQLNYTFFLTLFCLPQDTFMNDMKYQKITFTTWVYNKSLELILVLVVYKSTIVPIQPLISPLIHNGNPRFQIPQ